MRKKEVLTEDILTFSQNNHKPTKLIKSKHRENVLVNDIKIYPDEKKTDIASHIQLVILLFQKYSLLTFKGM